MSFYDFKANDINGKEISMKDYEGKVVLVVNTASKCGFTPQFEELESLHKEFSDKGLVILGFPCNQFMNQDPGTGEEIQSFCQLNYGVTFKMFEKVEVNGARTHPIFEFLKKEKKGALGGKIKWNFTKFLIDRNGNVVSRFAPMAKPMSFKGDIEKLL
ncbi:MAG: glutathione peroxidase [Sarcina sp.]